MTDIRVPASWKRVHSELGADHHIFRVRNDRLRHPVSGAAFDRVVLETPDWVNVVALTDDQHVVLVRQFRFGVREVTLEIPGGMVDPGESPRVAAARELHEETGYTAAAWKKLGEVQPNPAFLDNLCHIYLAEGARCTQSPTPDAGEDIAVTSLSQDAIRLAVRDGTIRHSLVLNALAFVLDLRS